MRGNRCTLWIIMTGALFLSACAVLKRSGSGTGNSKAAVLEIIKTVNGAWQKNNPPQERAFWDVAAYHTDKKEAYFITKEETYGQDSTDCAEHNQWMGAKSTNTAEWKHTYREKDDYVLFGDWQVCFQTY